MPPRRHPTVLTGTVTSRLAALVVVVLGLGACASDVAPTTDTESDVVETTVPADDGTTTTHELEQLPALDEDSAM